MSIKSGELIHVGNSVLVDRAQTAGPGSLNIPSEKIYELGNYLSVGTVYDTPDLKFSLESLDASAELEALLTGADFAGMTAGTEIVIANQLPLDIASQFKAGRTATAPFDVVSSVCIPFLLADSITYNFGLTSNASQRVELSGDSIYYSNGSTYIQEATGSTTAGQNITLSHTVLPYAGDSVGGLRYSLCVSLVHSGKRLAYGTDYTEAVTGAGFAKTVHVIITDAVPGTETIRIAYQSDVAATYPQVSHAAVSATRPAALRGRDIEVRVGGTTITDRWSSVQSFQLTWSATLDKDKEFGSSYAISQDFNVPEVRGTVEIKPRDAAELIEKISQIANVTDGGVVGPNVNTPLELEVLLHSPTDGSVLKTLYIPDARFTIPGYTGTQQQKLTVSIPFDSDSGSLSVFKGARVGGVTILSIAPTTKAQGSTGNIVITGTGFEPGAAVTISGTGVTVNSTTYNNHTQVTANITVAGGATVGARNVTVTNTDTGTATATGALTITV